MIDCVDQFKENKETGLLDVMDGAIMQGDANIMLSRKNFENLSGFKIIDFTNFRSDLFLERRKQSNVFNEIKNYVKFHFKQSFTEFENI